MECLVSGGFIYGYFGRTWENNNWMILVARQPKGLQSEEHQGEKMLYQITLLKKTHVVSNSTHLKKKASVRIPSLLAARMCKDRYHGHPPPHQARSPGWHRRSSAKFDRSDPL